MRTEPVNVLTFRNSRQKPASPCLVEGAAAFLYEIEKKSIAKGAPAALPCRRQQSPACPFVMPAWRVHCCCHKWNACNDITSARSNERIVPSHVLHWQIQRPRGCRQCCRCRHQVPTGHRQAATTCASGRPPALSTSTSLSLNGQLLQMHCNASRWRLMRPKTPRRCRRRCGRRGKMPVVQRHHGCDDLCLDGRLPLGSRQLPHFWPQQRRPRLLLPQA